MTIDFFHNQASSQLRSNKKTALEFLNSSYARNLISWIFQTLTTKYFNKAKSLSKKVDLAIVSIVVGLVGLEPTTNSL
ncbi:Hypothetical protein WP0701 [Wolbachia endosymbiont of Culex quinquefasciatus Pel]|nr:Hypothetical protein WP0701 [Wolbachia endosymbiont of Culex quinquefasciatus Pel]